VQPNTTLKKSIDMLIASRSYHLLLQLIDLKVPYCSHNHLDFLKLSSRIVHQKLKQNLNDAIKKPTPESHAAYTPRYFII